MGNSHVVIPQERLPPLCEQYHVRRLTLFGSVLRSDFRPDSDVDVLVDYAPGSRVSLFDMGELQVALSELIGREVDLKTRGFLDDAILARVQQSGYVLYECG